MKRSLLVGWLLFLCTEGSTQKLYSWTAVMGNWEDPNNWLPARAEPHAGDTLLFSSTAQISGLPEVITIEALYMMAGAKVIWQAATAATVHVTGVDTSLQVGAGSQLQLTGPGNIVILVQGVAAIDGSIYCSNGAHRIVAVAAGTNAEDARILLEAAMLQEEDVLEESTEQTPVIDEITHLPIHPTSTFSAKLASIEAKTNVLQASVQTGKILFKPGASFYAALKFSGSPFGTTSLNSVLFQTGSTYISMAGANPFGATAPAAVVVFEPGSTYKHQRSTAPQISGRKYGHFEIAANSSYNIALSADWIIENDLIISEGQFILKPNNGAGNCIIKGNIIHNGSGDFLFGGPSWRGKLLLETNEEHFLRGGANNTPIKIDNLIVRDGKLILEHFLSIGTSLQLDSAIINSNAVYPDHPSLLIMEAGSRFIFPKSDYNILHSTGYHAGYIEGSILWEGLKEDSSYAFPTGYNNRSRPVIIHGSAGDVLVRLHAASFSKLGPLAANDSIVLVDSAVYWSITGLQSGADIEIGYNIENWNFRPEQYRIAHFHNNYWKDLATGVEDADVLILQQASTGPAHAIGTVRVKYMGSKYYTIGSTRHVTALNYVPPARFRPNREENNDLIIYPNPVSEKLFIYFKSSRSKSRIDLVYITGAVVHSEEFEGERAVVDVSRLPKGMYFLQFRNKNLNRTHVFIKQ